jgi:spore maturation protein CgeB
MAIGDVEVGYREALEDAGVEVRFYNLTARIGVARQWVTRLWSMRGRAPEQQPTWPEAIYRASVEALEMALRYQVDWVVVVSGMFFHPDVLVLCARAGIKTAIILTESPYQDVDQARLGSLADVVWTNERTSIDRLGLDVPNIRYLPGAYSPGRHTPEIPVEDDIPEHDVVFVGTGFRERIETLMRINWSGIDLGLYGEWSLLGPTAKLRKFVRGPVLSNARTVQLYRRARIGLNLYRTSTTYGHKTPRIAHAASMNPRAYELAACEVFSLSDERAELTEVLGDAVPTFSTPAQLESLVRTYLNHSPERHRLARLARQRILPHTFAARAAHLLADLEHSERPRSLGRAS